MTQKNPSLRRVVKRKTPHDAAHGGSWKVAYADFVTAMMAFFLVMWIVSMDQSIRELIQDYFNDPVSASNSMAGISRLSAGGRSPIARGFGSPMDDRGWRVLAQAAQQERFQKVRQKLQEELARRPDLSRLAKHVTIRISPSGLMIELIEAEDGLFFETGSAVPPPSARRLLTLIAGELGRLANPVVIEGHTDVRPFQGKGGYSNWELSTDRANAARRVMEAAGLRPGQVAEVSGYAATRLRDPKRPASPVNRRVSILIPYQDPDEAAEEPDESAKRERSGATGASPQVPRSEPPRFEVPGEGGGDEPPFALEIKPARFW